MPTLIAQGTQGYRTPFIPSGGKLFKLTAQASMSSIDHNPIPNVFNADSGFSYPLIGDGGTLKVRAGGPGLTPYGSLVLREGGDYTRTSTHTISLVTPLAPGQWIEIEGPLIDRTVASELIPAVTIFGPPVSSSPAGIAPAGAATLRLIFHGFATSDNTSGQVDVTVEMPDLALYDVAAGKFVLADPGIPDGSTPGPQFSFAVTPGKEYLMYMDILNTSAVAGRRVDYQSGAFSYEIEAFYFGP